MTPKPAATESRAKTLTAEERYLADVAAQDVRAQTTIVRRGW